MNQPPFNPLSPLHPFKNWGKPVITLLAIAGLLVVGYYFFEGDTDDSQEEIALSFKTDATPEDIAAISSYQYTETYTHPTHRFSFKHPAGFTITPLETESEEVLLIESPNKKIGIQIMITPYGEDIDLTEDIVRASISETKMSDAQPVEIGKGRRGVAFLSDNPQFGGASREVWFVYKKNLYQISTYAEFDGFLKGMFGTWEFY